jgi:tetratricopeptide (TPR) repeat protein
MDGARFGRWSLALSALVIGLIAFPAIGYAQGQVRGKVVDANNKPVEGATVVIEMTKEMKRKFTVKSDKRGEYIQIGVPPGNYTVTATKDALSQAFEVRVGLDVKEVNFTLRPGSSAGGTDAERKKAEAEIAAVKTAFEEGVTLSNEGKYDESIAKFNEVLTKAPKCVECYNNIGAVYTRKKDFDQAEAAYKKALELKPDSVDAYNGLANVYNGQRKFDQAAEASAQAQKLASAAPGAAGGAASAGSVFNQGVIAWNAGKIPDAQKLFEQAVQLDPKLAEAHYWLGMANVNQNKLAEAVKYFEEYLKLEPKGQYVENAKGMLAAIKK